VEYLGRESVDAWNLDWQWRFGAEAVYMRRNNRAEGVPVIDGPERMRLSDFDFDDSYGTRLSLGIMEDDYELEITFLTLRNWNELRNGVLTNGLDFDGPAAYGAAAAAAQTAVDPGANPNFVTPATFFAPLNSAANAGGETDALDFLAPGATSQLTYTSDYQDLEVNYKQRSQPGRWLRWGLGFRNAKVRENGFAAFSGTFGSVDADGVGVPATAGLPSGKLTGAGLTFASGTDDGFIAGDNLLISSRTQIENRLYGPQVLAEMLWIESDHFDLGGFGKAGVYYNDARGSIVDQYSATGSNTSTYTRTLNDKQSNVAFLGHAGVTGRIYLRRNLRLTGGYEAIYLSGIALAPDQLQYVSTSTVGAASLSMRTDSSVFIHGGRVGLEILFP
jgi:hypothetical protein